MMTPTARPPTNAPACDRLPQSTSSSSSCYSSSSPSATAARAADARPDVHGPYADRGHAASAASTARIGRDEEAQVGGEQVTGRDIGGHGFVCRSAFAAAIRVFCSSASVVTG